jgi:hypothetical protein
MGLTSRATVLAQPKANVRRFKSCPNLNLHRQLVDRATGYLY